MSGLIAHCKKEMAIAGLPPLDGDIEDGPDKWIQENLLELAEVFSRQEHSGASAPFLLDMVTKLFAFLPLTQLTGHADEWDYVGENTYQNTRCYSIFKNGENGDPHTINGYVFYDDKGLYYTSNCSRKNIKFPYSPTKPEYVKEGSLKYYWLAAKHKLYVQTRKLLGAKTNGVEKTS